jgi:glycosyltransferase involved in cell wall biosynthesis
LCASRSEGFGLPLLEAMACRTPVVSTRVGGATDLIEEGREGYVVDVEDSEGLARRLVQVLSLDEPAWRVMSDAAFATATGYTWDDATDLFEAGLFEAMARNDLRTPVRETFDQAPAVEETPAAVEEPPFAGASYRRG